MRCCGTCGARLIRFPATPFPVAICGAGIAGLSLAITLAREGVRSVVLEARDTLSASGAGIQLGPNATRILHDIGIGDELARLAVAPDAIIVADAKSGSHVSGLPLGRWIETRHGAPYWVTHRADLQRALYERAEACDLIDIQFSCRVKHLAQKDATVIATLEDGRTCRALLFVGADGLWSKVREHVQPDYKLAYAGTTAARALLETSRLPPSLAGNFTRVWLAAKSHIVMYPISGGRETAIVTITSEPQPDAGWGGNVDASTHLAKFNALDPNLVTALHAANNWRQWALYDPKALQSWSRGNVVVIGDAAHPILPFLAQGGAMAIEDAYVLGRLIGTLGCTERQLLIVFGNHRQQRVDRMQRASRENGRIYHLGGIAAQGRNLAMRTIPPMRLMQRYDWIYGWRFNSAFENIELKGNV